MVFKFDLSSLTHSRVFFINPYCFKTSCKFFYQCLIWNFKKINKPMIICFVTQSSFKKFITSEKTLCAPLDIQRSKFVIIKTQSTKTNKTCLFSFSSRSNNTSWLEVFLEGKTTQGHNYITKHALRDQELTNLFVASIVQVLFISMC